MASFRKLLRTLGEYIKCQLGSIQGLVRFYVPHRRPFNIPVCMIFTIDPPIFYICPTGLPGVNIVKKCSAIYFPMPASLIWVWMTTRVYYVNSPLHQICAKESVPSRLSPCFIGWSEAIVYMLTIFLIRFCYTYDFHHCFIFRDRFVCLFCGHHTGLFPIFICP